jgi:hypothetical protein
MIRRLIPILLFSLLAICQQTDASEDEAAAYAGYFKYFLGEWSIFEESQDSEAGTWTVKPSPAGRAQNTVLELGDDISHGIYGYDPVTETWKGVGFSSKGSRWSETLKKTASDVPSPGDMIDYCGKSTANDGTVKLFRMRLTFIDRDAFTVKQMIVVVQSDEEPEIRILTAKRK